MPFRRAWIPAAAATAALLALVWLTARPEVAGPPSQSAVDGVRDLVRQWLGAWVHDPLYGAGPDDPRRLGFRRTGIRVRTLLLVLVTFLGALWTARNLPPTTRRRLPVAMAVCWTWTVAAAVLATTAAAPWLVAGSGQGHYMPARQVAHRVAEGLPVVAVFGMAAALVFAAVAVAAAERVDPEAETAVLRVHDGSTEVLDVAPAGEAGEAAPVEGAVPPVTDRPARLGATVGAAVLALWLAALNHFRFRAEVQAVDFGWGRLAEANDFVVRWVFFDVWQVPDAAPDWRWFALRALDVAFVVLFWSALRHLVPLLRRPGVWSVALAAVSATVAVAAVVRTAAAVLAATAPYARGAVPDAALSALAGAAPPALLSGLVAGLAAGVAVRVVGGGVRGAGAGRIRDVPPPAYAAD
ncbi:hypothetical protein AB0M28_16925 [Streptomyces sp. NPDC051940]|uniref:hypothetical protein n=1 Tax=Streptomyces sp. NPDC051940 TaxID=3155675 RepID=UPI00341E4D18